MIASSFKQDYENDNKIIIFAAGVSDSTEKRSSEYTREQSLLVRTLYECDHDTLFVYLSTTSVLQNRNTDSPYIQSKKLIEKIIINSGRNFIIFRLPQVVGPAGNPNNLINKLIRDIKNNEVVIKHVRKNIIDIDDVNKICNYYIQNNYINDIIDISLTDTKSAEEISKIIADKLKINLTKTVYFNGFEKVIMNHPDLMFIAQTLKLPIFSKSYTESVIEKYINQK